MRIVDLQLSFPTIPPPLNPGLFDAGLFGEKWAVRHQDVGQLAHFQSSYQVLDAQQLSRFGGKCRQGFVLAQSSGNGGS